jgi:hypothetical protein
VSGLGRVEMSSIMLETSRCLAPNVLFRDNDDDDDDDDDEGGNDMLRWRGGMEETNSPRFSLK